MKIVSWNLNGLRATVNQFEGQSLKGLLQSLQADLICLQETKTTRTYVQSYFLQLTRILGMEGCELKSWGNVLVLAIYFTKMCILHPCATIHVLMCTSSAVKICNVWRKTDALKKICIKTIFKLLQALVSRG